MEQHSIINYSEAIKAIKSAILQSRYHAAALINRKNHQPLADDLEINTKLLFDENRQTLSADLDWQYFLQIGFTHHTEIITKVKNTEERLFYIQRCATEFWSKEKLRYNLKSDLYSKQGSMLNNFTKAIADIDFRDMSKPMGVATYTLSSELPEEYRDILPDAETLRRLL
ncbi:hypothetical protein AGMMS49938_06870 [Fibrobacterales bacterium]|nr:hypothetical protein AGMMS49938_06870 [Fibrobacterales bacterium]